MGGVWVAQPGPQTRALETEADILFYGGAAGGGKTDLLIGAALTRHQRSIIYRRESTQLQGIYQRMAEILGSRDGFTSQHKIWAPPSLPDRLIEFGSAPHAGDEIAYQGRPHDLVGFDEITHFLESQFRFLMGWLRSTVPGQRKRVICTGNPPTDSDGDWVRVYWGPWLDPMHSDPAQPGELRWYVTDDRGNDYPVDGPDPIEMDGELKYPQSRTFIPALVQDNAFLMHDQHYLSTLQSMPEPLRSQMLYGDFEAGLEDNPWQVIPSSWVEAAMDRWEERENKGTMDSIGLDPSRGGPDETVLSARYGNWFDELKTWPGSKMPDGPAVAAVAVMEMRDKAPIHVDVIGIGSSVYDHLSGAADIHVVDIDCRRKTERMDKAGVLKFSNLRSELWWRMREALDPKDGENIALPPDSKLKADLCAPHYKPMTKGIQVEQKEDTKKRIGRSPGKGDAVVMANCRTMKRLDDDSYDDENKLHGELGWMG